MPTEWTLGLIAGITVYVGLLLARIPRVSPRVSGFLTATSTGILLFILIEIMAKVTEGLEELFSSASGGFSTMRDAWVFTAVLLLGLGVGLLGMSLFEIWAIRGNGKDVSGGSAGGAGRRSSPHRHLAFMIAWGLGIHNLTEGLAIAQAYAWGHMGLALFLAVGFGLHNATEGFGMAGPLIGHGLAWSDFGLLGLIAGGPTILGIWLGGLWQSQTAEILCYGLAAGAILYIVGELLHLGRKLKGELVAEAGLLAGFIVAFLTEMLLSLTGAIG